LGKNLKQVMRTLVLESNQEIFLKLTNNDLKKASSSNFIPEFNDEGIFTTCKKKKKVNFKKIIYQHQKNLSKLSSYKIATSILKTIIRKKHHAYDKKIVLDLDDVVKKIILDFLISILNKLNFKKPDMKPFGKEYRKLINFLNNELFTVFCFTTLRNFDSQRHSLLLPNDQILRLRTPEEFTSICDIKDAKTLPKINPNFQKIKFIIGTHISRTGIDEQKIKERFEKFLYGLKIFHTGNVLFGGIYYRDSVAWEIKPTICLKPEPKLGKPKTKYLLEYESFNKKDFEKFINNFSKINFTIGKYVFLGRSMKRFSQAIENENELDKIIDFVTCLESLYSSNEQQLSYRFAMRTANVLGQSPHDKMDIQDFILEIYNLRSKIIHGDEIPLIEVHHKKIELETCLKNLEMIARNSIKLFLKLINNFESKEKLHEMIDYSIYDPNLQKTFSKVFKEIRLPTINIFQK